MNITHAHRLPEGFDLSIAAPFNFSKGGKTHDQYWLEGERMHCDNQNFSGCYGKSVPFRRNREFSAREVGLEILLSESERMLFKKYLCCIEYNLDNDAPYDHFHSDSIITDQMESDMLSLSGRIRETMRCHNFLGSDFSISMMEFLLWSYFHWTKGMDENDPKRHLYEKRDTENLIFMGRMNYFWSYCRNYGKVEHERQDFDDPILKIRQLDVNLHDWISRYEADLSGIGITGDMKVVYGVFSEKISVDRYRDMIQALIFVQEGDYFHLCGSQLIPCAEGVDFSVKEIPRDERKYHIYED